MTHKSASAVTLLAALLAGCATPQERVRTVRVDVPVPVECPRPTMPARPPPPRWRSGMAAGCTCSAWWAWWSARPRSRSGLR